MDYLLINGYLTIAQSILLTLAIIYILYSLWKEKQKPKKPTEEEILQAINEAG